VRAVVYLISVVCGVLVPFFLSRKNTDTAGFLPMYFLLSVLLYKLAQVSLPQMKEKYRCQTCIVARNTKYALGNLSFAPSTHACLSRHSTYIIRIYQ